MAIAMALVPGRFLHSHAHAAFERFVVTAIDVEHAGKPLTVYTVAARFDSPNDSVLLAFRLKAERPEHLNGFWHCDALSGGLSQQAGSWSPSHFVRPTEDRPFDSHVTIGSPADFGNNTISDPAWSKGAADPKIGWVRPDLPGNGMIGWYVAQRTGEGPGRVGKSVNYEIAGKPTLENPATDVRLAQFVLSRGHEPRAFELTVAYSDGTEGKPQDYATGKFVLGEKPARGSTSSAEDHS